MPGDIEDFDAYMRGMLTGDDLFVTDAARELARADRHAPARAAAGAPAARARQPDHRRPAAARHPARSTACSWDPVRALALHGGAEYLKRVVVPAAAGRGCGYGLHIHVPAGAIPKTDLPRE